MWLMKKRDYPVVDGWCMSPVPIPQYILGWSPLHVNTIPLGRTCALSFRPEGNRFFLDSNNLDTTPRPSIRIALRLQDSNRTGSFYFRVYLSSEDQPECWSLLFDAIDTVVPGSVVRVTSFSSRILPVIWISSFPISFLTIHPGVVLLTIDGVTDAFPAVDPIGGEWQ